MSVKMKALHRYRGHAADNGSKGEGVGICTTRETKVTFPLVDVGPSADLRQRAEKILLKRQESPPADLQQAVHELQVRQLELEMQNAELRRSQKELETAGKKYFDLYDLAPVGYLTLNEKGLVIEVNLTVADLLCKDRNRLVRQPLMSLLPKPVKA